MSSSGRSERRSNGQAPVWLVRAGRNGQDEATALDLGLAIIGFTDVPSLESVDTAEQIAQLIQEANPDASRNNVSNRAGQLAAFRLRMKTGDIVALPLKNRTGRVALGRVSGPYRYQLINGAMRHTREVEWIRPDAARDEFGQDLLYSLGAFMTVCQIKRNNARTRIAAILNGRRDPVATSVVTVATDPSSDSEGPSDENTPLDIADLAQQQILAHLKARFTGHNLARLVSALLQAEGYLTHTSPPGPDGGVDILAGRGSLGLDSPRLCVQVKAGDTPISVDVLRALRGTMQTFNAEQGLLVSWGGFTSALEKEAQQSFFSVRLWKSSDVLLAVFRNYDRLPEEIQTELPLKRVWTLVLEDTDA